MKSLLWSVLLFCQLVASAQQESVDAFHADILIDSSGLITVKERIEIYATGEYFKRGIVRNLPLSRKDSMGRSIPVSYEVQNVLKNGQKSPYFTETKGGDLYIYAGEKSAFLEVGQFTYEIIYSTDGQIGFFKDFDELYWNVNGFGWSFPIQSVTASVTLPNGSPPLSTSCYTGSYGSTTSNCQVSNEDGKTLFTAQNIYKNENLSIVIGFVKGLVQPPPPPTFLQKFGVHILTLFFALALLVYYVFTWRKYGLDPPKPTVVPRFEPPDNLSPASLGMIRKGHFWQDLSTASLVDLAVKGYLKIEDHSESSVLGLFKSKKFAITRLKDADAQLPVEERQLLSVFSRTENQILFDGKYNPLIKNALDGFQSQLTALWNPIIRQGFNAKFWIFPIIFSLVYATLFFVWHRYFTDSSKFIYLVAFFMLNAVLFLFYQWLIRKPGKNKLRLRSEIEGFKMYLEAAEEKQLQHFNPPNITPEIFEKFLPYAMVLDVEDIWGEKFQKVLANTAMQKSYQPAWYNQPIGHIGDFGHALNSSFSNILSDSATKPSSRSAGGSGWSPGGFSGGGGGGGGGGGW